MLLRRQRASQVGKINKFTVDNVSTLKKRLKQLRERTGANKDGKETDALLQVCMSLLPAQITHGRCLVFAARRQGRATCSVITVRTLICDLDKVAAPQSGVRARRNQMTVQATFSKDMALNL